MIIRGTKELLVRYEELQSGDIFLGNLIYQSMKDRILIDLLERGVKIFPPALAQSLNNSKVTQAQVFRQWMIPDTLIINSRASLMATISHLNRQQVGRVVTKEDHSCAGYGIRYWDNIEHAYSQTTLSAHTYPFVIQPYVESYLDIRVIIVGDYVEAYTRENPNNFRNNISTGGVRKGYDLTASQMNFCRTVMKRGKFPYAHIDIMVLADGNIYLSEIALNGGLKGAKVRRKKIQELKGELLEREVAQS